jgi:hypothetical protein
MIVEADLADSHGSAPEPPRVFNTAHSPTLSYTSGRLAGAR